MNNFSELDGVDRDKVAQNLRNLADRVDGDEEISRNLLREKIQTVNDVWLASETFNQRKKKLKEQLLGVCDKGQELQEEWKEEKQEIKDNYDVEIVERSREYFVFEHEGSTYSSDWGGRHISNDETGEEAEGAPKEFAEEFTSSWIEKTEKFSDFVEEETGLTQITQDESGMSFQGDEAGLHNFTVSIPYVASELEGITVQYEHKKRLGNPEEMMPSGH